MPYAWGGSRGDGASSVGFESESVLSHSDLSCRQWEISREGVLALVLINKFKTSKCQVGPGKGCPVGRSCQAEIPWFCVSECHLGILSADALFLPPPWPSHTQLLQQSTQVYRKGLSLPASPGQAMTSQSCPIC